MKTAVTINGIEFNLTSTFKNLEVAPWSDGKLGENGKHRITVSTEHGRTSFDFWSSIKRPYIENEEDLIGAFECFILDALAGDLTYSDFLSEFGYDYNNESKKIHNKCVSHLNKLLRITANSDVYSISNELNEMIN